MKGRTLNPDVAIRSLAQKKSEFYSFRPHTAG